MLADLCFTTFVFFQTVLVGLARLVCMTNYVPKEKSPPLYEALKTVDPKIQKDFKKLKIKEMTYNKFSAFLINGRGKADFARIPLHH